MAQQRKKKSTSGLDKPNRKTTAPRKRKRANTGCLSGVLFFLFIVGVSTLLAGLGWLAADEVLGLTKPEGEIMIEIMEDDTLSDITAKLQDEGLVQYPWLFKLYANITGAGEKIVPGAYTVGTNLDYMAIVGAMKKNSQYRTIVKVVIPEGLMLRQIFALLAESKVSTEEELRQASKMYDFPYDYLKELPKADNRLEGYLFPDTYEFYVGEDPVDALSKMIANFDRKFTENMRIRAGEMDLSIHDTVIIASLIEREAANDDEAPTIASVIHNRLASSRYPWLQIDASILYILPEHKEPTLADLQIDSPYNTHLYEGLPPGPIASPGKSSLMAALDPDETDYYFYAVNKDGVHQFSRNSDEHNKVIRERDEARAAGGN